ncbi:MAG: PIN domain nuclease [Rhodospirillaceae bacterium]|nr:MAG: PIN domain nuclease [Rhodospirillaceae bacterium]
MIVVDSSIWIDHLNQKLTDQVLRLRDMIVSNEPILVGDLILCEVLQGLSSNLEAKAVEQALRQFPTVAMLDPDLAVRAAANYRLLRGKGVTVRKTIDLIVGTFCIAHDHFLLHADRDFEPMQKYLGLRTL